MRINYKDKRQIVQTVMVLIFATFSIFAVLFYSPEKWFFIVVAGGIFLLELKELIRLWRTSAVVDDQGVQAITLDGVQQLRWDEMIAIYYWGEEKAFIFQGASTALVIKFDHLKQSGDIYEEIKTMIHKHTDCIIQPPMVSGKPVHVSWNNPRGVISLLLLTVSIVFLPQTGIAFVCGVLVAFYELGGKWKSSKLKKWSLMNYVIIFSMFAISVVAPELLMSLDPEWNVWHVRGILLVAALMGWNWVHSTIRNAVNTRMKAMS